MSCCRGAIYLDVHTAAACVCALAQPRALHLHGVAVSTGSVRHPAIMVFRDGCQRGCVRGETVTGAACVQTKEAAAPGHAAAGGQAGGYVVNVPNQAPAGYGYNQGAPGVAAQPDPNAGAYNPTPGSPGMPPVGIPMGAPGAPGAPSPGAPSPGAPPPM